MPHYERRDPRQTEAEIKDRIDFAMRKIRHSISAIYYQEKLRRICVVSRYKLTSEGHAVAQHDPAMWAGYFPRNTDVQVVEQAIRALAQRVNERYKDWTPESERRPRKRPRAQLSFPLDRPQIEERVRFIRRRIVASCCVGVYFNAHLSHISVVQKSLLRPSALELAKRDPELWAGYFDQHTPTSDIQREVWALAKRLNARWREGKLKVLESTQDRPVYNSARSSSPPEVRDRHRKSDNDFLRPLSDEDFMAENHGLLVRMVNTEHFRGEKLFW